MTRAQISMGVANHRTSLASLSSPYPRTTGSVCSSGASGSQVLNREKPLPMYPVSSHPRVRQCSIPSGQSRVPRGSSR